MLRTCKPCACEEEILCRPGYASKCLFNERLPLCWLVQSLTSHFNPGRIHEEVLITKLLVKTPKNLRLRSCCQLFQSSRDTLAQSSELQQLHDQRQSKRVPHLAQIASLSPRRPREAQKAQKRPKRSAATCQEEVPMKRPRINPEAKKHGRSPEEAIIRSCFQRQPGEGVRKATPTSLKMTCACALPVVVENGTHGNWLVWRHDLAGNPANSPTMSLQHVPLHEELLRPETGRCLTTRKPIENISFAHTGVAPPRLHFRAWDLTIEGPATDFTSEVDENPSNV